MQVIDMHCDTILRLIEQGPDLALASNEFSVDLEKLRTGQSLAQFFAMYINLKTDGDPLVRALRMIDRFYRELEANHEHIALAVGSRDIETNRQAGKVSALLTIEEGGALKGDIVNLRTLYRLGVRLITLTWNYPNEIGYPNCLAECQAQGLTPFGREVVAEMNRLGMIIDVSHLSDQGFYDVANLSTKPFVASHSNARVVANHTRNLTDDMIKLLAEKGGVMGINFEKSFLGSASISRVADMVDHIKHIYQVGGSDVIAIGSDFDGISKELEIAHIGQIGKLIDALAEHGFSRVDIEKICAGNALRVIQETLN